VADDNFKDITMDDVSRMDKHRELVLMTDVLLASHRSELAAIAERFGVRSASLFGSRARDEANAASDLDLLVRMEAGRSLLDLVGFKLAVQELLGIRVDVVTESGLSPYLRERILQEAVPIDLEAA
jgi:hypothetical protein